MCVNQYPVLAHSARLGGNFDIPSNKEPLDARGAIAGNMKNTILEFHGRSTQYCPGLIPTTCRRISCRILSYGISNCVPGRYEEVELVRYDEVDEGITEPE